jgi:hypothetical protein
MTDPTTLTAADLVAFFAGNPAATATILLARGRLLKAREIIILVRVTRGGPVLYRHFARLVDHIARRWYRPGRPPAGAVTEAHKGKTQHREGGTATAPAGVRASAPAISSETTRRQAPAAAAGLEGIRTDWTLTIRPAGRVILEVPE